MLKVTEGPPLKTLVFDFETRPGAYWYDDTTTTLVCAWAAKFLGEERVYSTFMVPLWLAHWAQREVGDVASDRRTGMAQFLTLWNEADRVVTHNGKRFDVPVINGAMDRLGLPPLSSKPHIDTLSGRAKSRGVKRSLEALAERYNLGDAKLNVSSETWERAYEFNPVAMRTVIERAESDVQLTERLYCESIRRGVLR